MAAAWPPIVRQKLRLHRPGVGMVRIQLQRGRILRIRFRPTSLIGQQKAENPTATRIIRVERDRSLGQFNSSMPVRLDGTTPMHPRRPKIEGQPSMCLGITRIEGNGLFEQQGGFALCFWRPSDQCPRAHAQIVSPQVWVGCAEAVPRAGRAEPPQSDRSPHPGQKMSSSSRSNRSAHR